MSLSTKLSDGDTRERVVDDCCQLVDDEVSRKSGLGGLVIKAGYKTVKGIKPGFIRKVVSSLLDEWTQQLDPIWEEGAAEGSAPDHLKAQRGRVAEALLSVTDAKAQDAKSGLVAKTYKKLRPTAKEHVEQAVPGLADLLSRHAA